MASHKQAAELIPHRELRFTANLTISEFKEAEPVQINLIWHEIDLNLANKML